MPKVARKVTLSKWRGAEWGSVDRIPADVISVDLRSSANTLSFWQVPDDDPRSFELALLALFGTLERFEAIDIVLIDEADLDSVERARTNGDTFFKGLAPLHVDLIELDADKLCLIAKAIAANIYSGKSVRFTRRNVIDRVRAGIAEHRVRFEDLPEKIAADLR